MRDKIAASRLKGKWTGGTVPLGYEAKDKTLVVNKMEAEAVRAIFRRYLELQSFSRLVAISREVRFVPRTVHREREALFGRHELHPVPKTPSLVFYGTGGASWREGSLRESSSLRLCG
jgi:hypothetical protein